MIVKAVKEIMACLVFKQNTRESVYISTKKSQGKGREVLDEQLANITRGSEQRWDVKHRKTKRKDQLLGMAVMEITAENFCGPLSL